MKKRTSVLILIATLTILGWPTNAFAQTTNDCLQARSNLVLQLNQKMAEVATLWAQLEQLGDCGFTNRNVLTIEPVAQPTSSLAPLGAQRIPFTRVQLSALRETLVTGLTVERTGLSVDEVLESISLLNENGIPIGKPAYINAEHIARLSTPFTVYPGQTRVLTIAGNRPYDANAAHAGTVVSLTVTGVHTTEAPVQGALPVVGASHVIHEGLSIGSMVAMRGPSDPGAGATLPVGSQYTFSSIRVVAGSLENIWLQGIRWYQSGTIAPSDINVATYIDGIAYETAVSADGRYYTAMFDNGVLLQKGSSKEILIRGDVLSGFGKTIDFDIESRNDVYAVGQLYYFGIRPPLGASVVPVDSAGFNSTDDPWYDAAEVLIENPRITVRSPENQLTLNLSRNVPNQHLGTFTTYVTGEPISFGRLGLSVTITNGSAASDVDDLIEVNLVDDAGNVVAGPIGGSAVDSPYTSGFGDGSLIFTDTVTFPVGTSAYHFKGRLSTDIPDGAIITITTTPSTDFAIGRGQSSGIIVAGEPTSSVTVGSSKAIGGALTIGVFEQKDWTAIAGSRSVDGGTIRLYATASSEAVRIITLPIRLYRQGDLGSSAITNVRLFDGNTSVVTGSNIVNPTPGDDIYTFILDGTGLIIPEGGSKDLTLRFDIGAAATGSLRWSLPVNLTEDGMLVTGLTTAEQIRPALLGEGTGPMITVAEHGELGTSYDPSSTTVVGPSASSATIRVNFASLVEGFSVSEMEFAVATNPGGALPVAVVGESSSGGAVPAVVIDGKFTLVFDQNNTALINGTGCVNVLVSEVAWNELTLTLVRVRAIGSMSGELLDLTPNITHTVRFEPATVQTVELTNITRLDGGFVEISMSGLTPGQEYELESSLDLVSWMYTGYRFRPETNVVTKEFFLGTVAHEFYRLRTPPGLSDRSVAERIPLSFAERRLLPGTTPDKVLSRFKVRVPESTDSFELAEFSHFGFIVGETPPVKTSDYTVYVYTDSTFSQPDAMFSSAGAFNESYEVLGEKEAQRYIRIWGSRNGQRVNYRVVPGQTRYFELRATIADVSPDFSATNFVSTLLADMAGLYPGLEAETLSSQ